LGLAPGATVHVYLTGTGTLASLFTNAALSNPLANPFTTDVNAFYAYFVDPANGDLDEQFSGTGIVTPYTLADVLNLDPRVGAGGGDIATLQAELDAETAARQAADLAIEQAGFMIPLGGSLSQGQSIAVQTAVVDGIVVTIPTLPSGYTATVEATLRTDDAGTSVTAILRDLTAAANVGSSTAVNSTTNVTQTFAVTLIAGHQYALQRSANNDTNGTYVNGVIHVQHP
jgi:hypothetical protein